MAYQRPPFRTPFSAFALQNPMPIPGQFFNTGPPLNARPLLPGFGNPGFRLPPQLRPNIPINLQQPQQQQHQQQQLRHQHQSRQPRSQVPTPIRINAPPKTTVFVGNISEEVETDLLQKMCEECGIVNSFRRLQGANGKPQAFGFCEFNSPDATRRALRLLNAFTVGGKPLLLKVEEKVMNQIHEYLNSLRQDNGLLPLPAGTEFPITDEERDGDIIAKKRIIEMIEAIDKNLLREPDPPPQEPKKEEKKALSSSESEDDRRENRDRSRQRRRHHGSRSPRRHRSRSPRGRSSRRDRSPRSERSSKKSKKRRHSDSEEDIAKRRERQFLKEREEAYQRRLKKWEDKEVRFAREVEKDREKERQKRKAAEKEATKLQLFHENYDDDVDDQKYYRGDLLIQRRRMLEQQLELDRKDREAEEAEFEKMKTEILATNPEKLAIIEEEARKRKENEETKMNIKFGIKSTPIVPKREITPDADDDADSRPVQFKVEPQNSGWESVDSPSVSVNSVPSLGKKIKVETACVTTNGLFADDDEEEEAKKKKKLQPFIISSEERIAVLTPDERKRMIRDLIDKIPKSREQIFAYPMKWEYLDDPMIETRIRPWIAKKVILALGEQEPDLTTFICECVKKRSDPKKLVLDLSMVFDEEAESFITKMWRLIIYETEARYKGLSTLSATAGGPSI